MTPRERRDAVRLAVRRAVAAGRSDREAWAATPRGRVYVAGWLRDASPRVVEAVALALAGAPRRVGLVGSAIPPADAARVGARLAPDRFDPPSPALGRMEDVT